MLLNKNCDFCLADPSCRHPGYKIHELVTCRLKGERIQAQEDQHGHETNALVAIDEGMPLDQMKEIGGSHLGQAFMQPSASVRRLRHGQSGFQQGDIANSRTTPVPLDLVRVQCQHFIEREKLDLHFLLGEPPERATVSPVRFFDHSLELGRPLPSADGRDHNDLSVGRHFERGARVYPHPVEERLVEYQR